MEVTVREKTMFSINLCKILFSRFRVFFTSALSTHARRPKRKTLLINRFGFRSTDSKAKSLGCTKRGGQCTGGMNRTPSVLSISMMVNNAIGIAHFSMAAITGDADTKQSSSKGSRSTLTNLCLKEI